MRYVNLISRVIGASVVSVFFGAMALSANAQESIKVMPPSDVEPPAGVAQPEVSSQPPARGDATEPVGAVDDTGSGATGVAAPEGAGLEPGPADAIEAMVPDTPDSTSAQQNEADAGSAGSTATVAELIGKSVVDSDGKDVGIVSDVKVKNDGAVKEVHVRTSGFFGFGAKTLVVPSELIKKTDTNVQLKLVSAELGNLAEVKTPKG